MGVGPIPRSKAMGYAREHDIKDGDGLDRFWSIIHAVDSKYLADVNSTKKTDSTIAADDVDGVRGMFRARIEQQKKKQAAD